MWNPSKIVTDNKAVKLNRRLDANRVSTGILACCPFCGLYNKPQHYKYADRCEDCGKLYCRYATYKSMQKNSFSSSREAVLDEIISTYRDYKKQGLKVPRDI